MNREFEQAAADIQRIAKNYSHVAFIADGSGRYRHSCGGDRNAIVAGVIDGLKRLAEMFDDPEMLEHIAWEAWKNAERMKHPEW